MSWYESQVDQVVGLVPDYKYHMFGQTYLPEQSTRGFAKSVLMPGHVLADIYEGDAEAILYAEQAAFITATALATQYAITGAVSERALYGIGKAFTRAPTAILAFEAGYYITDIERLRRGEDPKSLTLRGIQAGALYLTRSRKTGEDVRSFKFMERN